MEKIKQTFNRHLTMLNYCHGFTLAEILITLAIIGVIAVLTLTTLIEKYKKLETITKLKKSLFAY